MGEPRRILVVKLSALGNIVLSLGPFAAIRRHHEKAEITLLTTRPYAAWMADSPYFDRVWLDTRPAWWNLAGTLRLRQLLAELRFERVYDLQTSARSSAYFRLFPGRARPEWSGIAPGCSHPDRDQQRDRLHDADRQAGQLRQAGIREVPLADLSWCAGDITRFALPRQIALLVPGSSAHRPEKRWPAEHFATLASRLTDAGLTPVLIGTAGEAALGQAIRVAVQGTVDLIGQTDFADLASLARAAQIAVGNDTGPMHLIAAASCPSVVLFSHASDPALCAPRGAAVSVLRRRELAELDPAVVLAAALSSVQFADPAAVVPGA